MADPQGKDFRARVRLSDRRDVTLAEIGETCERVALQSLAGLLADGFIELVPAVAPVPPVAEPSETVSPAAGEE